MTHCHTAMINSLDKRIPVYNLYKQKLFYDAISNTDTHNSKYRYYNVFDL